MVEIVRRWNMKPFSRTNIEEISDVCGVYVLMNRNGYVQYVGYSTSLRTRLLQRLNEQKYLDLRILDVRYFMCYQTRGEDDAIRLEKQLIEEHKPPYNK